MKFELIKTEIPDVLLLKPTVFSDERGCFYETYNKNDLSETGLTYEFLQDNQSVSNKGVLRGLHFQNPPYEQGKLIRVAKGAVIDVVVDIRKKSQYYGKHFSVELSDKNNYILWVPAGFAHGFYVLEDNTIFLYKCTQVYNKESEGAILWNDPHLNINWNTKNPIISDKDKLASSFMDFVSQF
jgi:dTDP-4-dehydrorhamnose 3,5-epimerase